MDKSALRQRARSLRKNSTDAERHLWYHLRAGRQCHSIAIVNNTKWTAYMNNNIQDDAWDSIYSFLQSVGGLHRKKAIDMM